MNKGKDRQQVRDAITARWPVSAARRKTLIKATMDALKIAEKQENVRAINSCVRTIATLEGQNQTDEHLALQNFRLDNGQPVGGVTFIIRPIVETPPVTEEPNDSDG